MKWCGNGGKMVWKWCGNGNISYIIKLINNNNTNPSGHIAQHTVIHIILIHPYSAEIV